MKTKDVVYKNAPEYREPVEEGLKTATVRYEDEQRVVPGDTLAFEDTEDGTMYGYTTVVAVVHTPLRQALSLIDEMGFKHPASSFGQLVYQMERHYADGEFHASTAVRVVGFEPP